MQPEREDNRLLYIMVAFLVLLILTAVIGGYRPPAQPHGTSTLWIGDVEVESSPIDWGTLVPGENATHTVTVHNSLNRSVTLNMTTSNYAPAHAVDYLTVTWNYTGTPIPANHVWPVQFTLHVSPAISMLPSSGTIGNQTTNTTEQTRITTFSFDIHVAWQ